MGAALRELKIERNDADRGALLSAPEVAELICQAKFSARWVIERMGPTIGLKPGREWLFYEADARKWWTRFLEAKRGRI
jgi:hypothetical protein